MKALVILLLLLLQSCNEIMPPTMAAPKVEPPIGKPIEGDRPEVETAYPAPQEEVDEPVVNTPESEIPVVVIPAPPVVEVTPIVQPEVTPAPIPVEETPVPVVVVPTPVEEIEEVPGVDRSPAVEPEIEVVEEPSEETPVVNEPAQPVQETPVVSPEPVVVIPTPAPEVVQEEPEQEEPLYPSIPLVSSSLIAQDAKEVVSLFVFYAGIYNKSVDWSKLIIEIQPSVTTDYIAYCSRVNNNQNPKITVNGKFWTALSGVYREQLLFHELGHCLLNRVHEGDNFYNPHSIMNKTLFSDQIYKSNYDYFLKELFSGLDNNSTHHVFGENYIHIQH